MNQQNKNTLNTPSFGLGVILFFGIVLVSFVPIIVEQSRNPEKMLPYTQAWHIMTKSTDQSVWEASDGSTANHVSTKPTNVGFEVILQPTELTTREAFFNEGLITTDAFKLSTEVNTPTGCHNGLVFRGNKQGEYYLFLVDSVGYTVEILQRESNSDLPREAIILNTIVSDAIGRPRDLAIIGKGDSYYFYINGTYVNQMSDSRLKGNRVGVEAFT